MSFDPVEICAVLSEEGVEFVVLGGFAAIIHGSPLPTEDIDVIPSRSGANLERPSGAASRGSRRRCCGPRRHHRFQDRSEPTEGSALTALSRITAGSVGLSKPT